MAKTPETLVKDRFKKRVKEVCEGRGMKYKLIYNGGQSFSAPTLDVTGVISGWPIAVELKRLDGKGKLTGRQILDIKEFKEAGALAFCIDSEQSFTAFFALLGVLPIQDHIDFDVLFIDSVH